MSGAVPRGIALAVLLATALLLCGPSWAADEFKVEEGYVSLFNGKDLTGWRYGNKGQDMDGKTETPDGRFSVEDGIIVAHEKDRAGKGGIKDLYTVKSFARGFRLKLEFRAGPKADSGVYVRGPQLQVRDFIRRGEHREMKKFKTDGWNELDIALEDGVLTTTLNGRPVSGKDVLEVTVKDGKPSAKLNGQAVDVKDLSVAVGAVAVCTCNGEPLEVMRKLPAKGPIGLQAETGKFEFRRIRIKEQ
jgi:hypothetical protein